MRSLKVIIVAGILSLLSIPVCVGEANIDDGYTVPDELKLLTCLIVANEENDYDATIDMIDREACFENYMWLTSRTNDRLLVVEYTNGDNLPDYEYVCWLEFEKNASAYYKWGEWGLTGIKCEKNNFYEPY